MIFHMQKHMQFRFYAIHCQVSVPKFKHYQRRKTFMFIQLFLLDTSIQTFFVICLFMMQEFFQILISMDLSIYLNLVNYYSMNLNNHSKCKKKKQYNEYPDFYIYLT